jgi:hypothetical protein
MSGGYACHCEERDKPIAERAWFVTQRRCNHSAFSGYHYTPSAWSTIRCPVCRTVWRTKASYVNQLKDLT